LSDATVRRASAADAGAIVAMIRELAEFERLLDRVQATEASLREALFSERPPAAALVAELDGQPVGYAIYFTTFSTFLARPGIWLEDLYVRPAARRAGIGRLLFAAVAAEVIAAGGARMEWSALDWNERALAFYRSLGAETLDDWLMLRLTGEALERAATASA
jgi:GNAT superfamily N-acetyltransferase